MKVITAVCFAAIMALPAHGAIVGQWTFDDGTLNDTSGYATPVNGTFGNGATFVTDPVRGNVVSIPTRSSFVWIDNAPKFHDTNEFTFSAWVKSTDSFPDRATVWPYVAQMWNDWAVQLVASSNATARAFVWPLSGDPEAVWNGGPNVADGQWHNMTFVFSASRRELSLYVDYIQIATAQPCNTTQNRGGDSPIRLGSDSGALVCLIDDVTYYNTALTQSDITGQLPALRVQYSFSGNANDTANYPYGTPMNGTLNGTAAITTDGCNQVAAFDGTTRCHISVPVQAKLNISTNLTMMGWVKPGTDSGAAAGLVRRIMGFYPYYEFTWTRNAFTFQLYGPTSPSLVTTSGTTGKWQHVAGTYDGSNIKLYVNGNLVVTQPATGGVWLSDVPFGIGAGYSHFISGDHFITSSEFTGSIDDVRVLGKALSQSEIQQYMNTGFVMPIAVTAGPVKWAQLPANSVQLDGDANNAGGTYTLAWTKDSGPGTVTFTPSNTVKNATATFSAAGDYVLRLTTTDSSNSSNTASDTVKVKIYPAGPGPLVAHYTFDVWDSNQLVYETSGYNTPDQDLTGYPNGGATVVNDPAGVRGKVLMLDGADGSFVDCGVADRLDFTSAITVAAWVKATGPIGHRWGGIAARSGNWVFGRAENFCTVLQIPGVGGTATRVIDANGTIGKITDHMYAGDVNDGRWHHVAGTYDGKALRIYIDGILAATNPGCAGQIGTAFSNLIIGSYTTNDGFPGYIDDVRIYEQALSDTQIAALVPKGSLNADNKVNLKDVAILGSNWQKDGTAACNANLNYFYGYNGYTYIAGDFNRDCKVTMADVAVLAETWLATSSN